MDKHLLHMRSLENGSLNYEHINLISRHLSEIDHRSECNTSIEFCGINLDIPIIASPMNDVCNGEMAYKLASIGALGFIHRFQTIDEQSNEYSMAWKYFNYPEELKHKIGCAIGVTGDYVERFEQLYDDGCRIYLADTANGHNNQVGNAIEKLKLLHNDIYLVTGNIATQEGFKYLADREIDGVRISIGSGSPCSTRYETAIYNHPVSVLLEILLAKYIDLNNLTPKNKYPKTKLVIDGGIKKPDDFCKVISLGADAIMAGGIFAGTDESPGNVLMSSEGVKSKIYRGAASYSTQYEFTNKKPEYVEGEEKIIPYKGGVDKVIKRFKHGLQSSMSYCNARTIQEYQQNVDFVILK